MVLINQSHKLLKTVLCLEPFLFGLPVLVSLFLVNLLFVLEALLCFVEADLNGNEVSLHTVHHVLILALDHELVVICVLNFIKLFLGIAQTSCLAHNLFLDATFFFFCLLELSLLAK